MSTVSHREPAPKADSGLAQKYSYFQQLLFLLNCFEHSAFRAFVRSESATMPSTIDIC
jgi:hypothetical protein